MLESGAKSTALKSYLSTERECFWQQEFEISLTPSKLSIVGFSAAYKDVIWSSNHLRLGFSAEVSKPLYCKGKAQLSESCWSHVSEEPQSLLCQTDSPCSVIKPREGQGEWVGNRRKELPIIFLWILMLLCLREQNPPIDSSLQH